MTGLWKRASGHLRTGNSSW